MIGPLMRPFRLLAEARGVASGAELAATARRVESMGYSVLVTTDDARGEVRKLAATLEERTGVVMSEEDLLESPQIFNGSMDGLTEKFRTLRERFGISSIMVGEIDELAPVVERLAGT